MNFFKRNLPGYTLLELMVTISISAFLLMLCFTIHQRQHKKILSNERYLRTQKECLDFFTKTTLFISVSVCFTQKDARTLELQLAPDEKNPQGRRLEIQLNGQRHATNTLNISTKHIQEFSWSYWDFKGNQWTNFNTGKTYSNLSFIQVTLWDRNRKPLDTFVYSCYTNTQ